MYNLFFIYLNLCIASIFLLIKNVLYRIFSIDYNYNQHKSSPTMLSNLNFETFLILNVATNEYYYKKD